MDESIEDTPLEPTLVKQFPFRESPAEWTKMEVVWDNSIRFMTVKPLDDSKSDTNMISLSEYRPQGNQVDGDDHAVTTHTTTARPTYLPYLNQIVCSGRYGKIIVWKADDEICEWKLQFGSRPSFKNDARTPCSESSLMRVLTWFPPNFVWWEHGELYDFDFDDSRARLVLYMSDGTIFMFDFI